MKFNLKMFDVKDNIISVESKGYESIIRHSHDFVEVVYVANGHGEHIIGEKKVKIKQGDVFIIADTEIEHSIRPLCDEENFSILNILFPHKYFEIEYGAFSPFNIFKIDEIPGGRELINEIKEEYDEKKNCFEKINYALTLKLLCLMMRTGSKSAKIIPNENVKLKNFRDYIDFAVKFIRANYDKNIKLGDIADECGLCHAYLQRLFKSQRNTTPLEYLNAYRIEQSCKLLIETDKPISEIAILTGFNDLKYFYLRFKRSMNCTPNQFRQNKRCL